MQRKGGYSVESGIRMKAEGIANYQSDSVRFRATRGDFSNKGIGEAVIDFAESPMLLKAGCARV